MTNSFLNVFINYATDSDSCKLQKSSSKGFTKKNRPEFISGRPFYLFKI